MKQNKFAVLILTNNRPNNVLTIKTLRNHGYTGKICLVLDDRDKTIESYKENYPDEHVYVFCKKYAMEITDSADNTENDKAVVYARNMTFIIAKELKLDYFLVLDDDYGSFTFRSTFSGHYKPKKIQSLDSVILTYIDFLRRTEVKCIAMAQGGDYIGGHENKFGQVEFLDRKCMNSFFCKTDRPFEFYGLINEDVTMYTLNATRGDLYFTTTGVSLGQAVTQTNDGGLTTIYLELGTYVKSFYSVMFHPSSICVKICVKDMGIHNKRLHHSVNKELTYPKILSEGLKK